jgi:hypothetical protein
VPVQETAEEIPDLLMVIDDEDVGSTFHDDGITIDGPVRRGDRRRRRQDSRFVTKCYK